VGHLVLVARCVAIFADQTAPNECPSAPVPPPLPPLPVGTLGTLSGGQLLDKMGSSMRNALLLCTLGIGAGACLAVLAFWAAASFGLFSLIFALAQFAMFVSQVGGWDARGRGWAPGCG
jgi:hypothetical protein